MFKRIIASIFVLTLALVIPANAQNSNPTSATLQNRATANGNGTVLQTLGLGSATLTITCTSCAGTTINFEGTADGTNYTAITATTLDGATSSTTTTASGVTQWSMAVSGLRNIRTRISGYSAGTVTITGNAVQSGGGAGGTINAAGLATSARQVLGGTAGTPSIEVQSVQGVPNGTPIAFAGGKTNNAATPGATNIGTLPAVANAAAPTLTETFQNALSVDLSGGLRLASIYTVADPCDGSLKTKKTFAISSATTTVLVSASASNKVYICSYYVQPISATGNVEMVEDASGSCASPDAGLFSAGTTDTTGANMVANQGFSFGNGGAMVEVTASTNVNVCLITSTTAKVNGVITYVLAP